MSARIMVRAYYSIAAVDHQVEQARYRTHTSIIFECSESKNDICFMASVQGATSCIEECSSALKSRGALIEARRNSAILAV